MAYRRCQKCLRVLPAENFEGSSDVCCTSVSSSYLAGFFDGEGTIAVLFNPSGSVSLTVRVSQMVREPLDAFVVAFPRGHVSRDKRGLFNFYINGKAAGEMLVVLLPDLLVKREQAVLAVQIAEVFHSSSKHATAEEKTFAKEAHERMKEMKRPWLRAVNE